MPRITPPTRPVIPATGRPPELPPPGPSSAAPARAAGALEALPARQAPAGLPPRAPLPPGRRRNLAPSLNLFEGSPDFKKMNAGDPRAGVVVHLPQTHCVGGLTWEEDEEILMAVLESQSELLKILHRHRAVNVIDELGGQALCEQFRDLAALVRREPEFIPELATVSAIVAELTTAEDLAPLLERFGKSTLLSYLSIYPLGVAYGICLQARAADAPVMIHAATPPAFQGPIEAAMKDASEESTQFVEFMFGQREGAVARMAPAVLETRPGEPAFLIFGAAHDFQQAFSSSEGPALYRFRSAVSARVLAAQGLSNEHDTRS